MRRIQNYTPTTYANQKLAAGTKRKRSGPRLSCNECRRQKIKCDRGHPCEACLKQAPRVQCIYGEPESHLQENGSADSSSPDTLDSRPPLENGRETAPIERRMEKLENLVERLAAKVDKFGDAAVGTDRVILPRANAVIVRRQEPGRDEEVPPGNDSVFVGLKHQSSVVMGMRQGIPFYIGMTGWCVNHYNFEECCILFKWPKTFGRQWASYGELKSRFKGWRQPSILDALPILEPSAPTETDLLSLVPSEEISRVLISRFLLTLNVTYPIVESDVLQEEMNEFWKTKKPKSSTWLAYLLAIMGIGYQLPVVSFPGGITIPRSQVLGKEIMSKITQFVYSSPMTIRRPDNTTFQTFLLLIVARKLHMEHPDGSDSISGLLSITGKLAFSMGLHRDPVMAPVMPVSDIKLRRKLWNTFLFFDFENSIHTGMPFTIRPTDYDTIDPDSSDDLVSSSHGSTYQQCLSEAIPVWADVVHLTHSTKLVPSNDEIYKLDARLRKVDVLPYMYSGAEDLGGANSFRKAICHAILDCINHRMRSILNFGMLDKSDPSVKHHALAVLLHSAMGILKHQEYINALVEEADLACQGAWSHFALSILRFDFFSASKDIMFLLRESRNGIIPIPGGADLRLDVNKLFHALTSQDALFNRVITFSLSCIKERVMFAALRDGVWERLRICQDLKLSSLDFHTDEARPVILAMQKGMEGGISEAREAIDAMVNSLDPPPALAEWIAQKATTTSSQASVNGDLDISNTEPMYLGGGAEDLMPMALWLPEWPELPWPFSETTAQDPGWWNSLEDPAEQNATVGS